MKMWKCDDHLNATIATLGLTLATLILLSSVAYSAISGKSFDVVSSTLAGTALAALGGIARRSAPPPASGTPNVETRSPNAEPPAAPVLPVPVNPTQGGAPPTPTP